MNTVGHKMNNKLTSVIGNKFNHKFHSMGHKMMPILHQVKQQLPMRSMSNVMVPNPQQLNKKIMDYMPMKKMKNRLTK